MTQKTELIHVRVTPQEKDLIDEWAAAEGRSMASLIHHRLFLSAGAAVDRLQHRNREKSE